jgi:hypothetical protein
MRPTAEIASGVMRRLLSPLTMGVSAARHLAWYLNYQMTGETREDGD